MLVNEFLENSATRSPDKVAIICDEKRLTFRQINSAADLLAKALLNSGVKRQDRVVIFLDNSAEAVISLFGILKAGCIFIMLNAEMKAKKLQYILNDSGASVLITQTTKQKTVEEAIQNAANLRNIIWCQGRSQISSVPGSCHIPSNIQSVMNWDTLLASISSDSLTNRFYRTIDLDIATIIYTSGSTGEPKGVVSAHYNVVAAVTSITTYLENTEKDIILCALPLSFDYGLYQVLMAIFFGGTVVIQKSFVYPYKVIEKLVSERVTGFPIVPTMVAILLQMEKLSEFDFSSLRYLTNTAAALPIAYIKKLQEIFPKTRIYSMYGLTECKRVSYLPPEYIDSKPNSVGIPIPNEEVFIVDENGNELKPGAIGELVVRGANVMQGYWNAPEETAKVYRPGRFRSEALLHTKDLFKMDKDGFLYFVARKDDIIKTKGERVSPKEIENILCDIEGISEAAVIGVPDDIFGSAIKAFVVLKANSQLTEKEILRFCSKNLEPFMVPKYIEFRESFPKSNSGKIDKKQLQ